MLQIQKVNPFKKSTFFIEKEERETASAVANAFTALHIIVFEMLVLFVFEERGVL